MAGVAPGSTTASAFIMCAGFRVCLAEGGGSDAGGGGGGGTGSGSGGGGGAIAPPRWGCAWTRGRRDAFEDAFSIDLSLGKLPTASSPRPLCSLFGVFDGHAGSEVATFSAQRIAAAVKNAPAFARGDAEAALTQAFVALDAQLEEPSCREELSRLRLSPGGELPSEAEAAERNERASVEQPAGDDGGRGGAGQRNEGEGGGGGGGSHGSKRGGAYGVYDARSGFYLGPEAGTTALVALVLTPPPALTSTANSWDSGGGVGGGGRAHGHSRTVIAASIGDSRALLGLPGAGGRAVRCVSLTRTHTAALPAERARVDAAGLATTPEGRVATATSSVAMTRALGDARYKAAAPLRGGPSSADVVIGGDAAGLRFAERAGDRATAAGSSKKGAAAAAAEGRADAVRAAGTRADQVARHLRSIVPYPDIAVVRDVDSCGGSERDASASGGRADDGKRWEDEGAQRDLTLASSSATPDQQRPPQLSASSSSPEKPQQQQQQQQQPQQQSPAAAAASRDADNERERVEQQRARGGPGAGGPPTIVSPFLLLACDGVFESMANDAAVALIARRLAAGSSPAQAVAALVDTCLRGLQQQQQQQEGGGGGGGSGDGVGRRSRDNITALVVDLGALDEEGDEEGEEGGGGGEEAGTARA